MDVKIGISIVIITKNEADTISRVLDSATGIADEIILVDSGSDDSTLHLAKRHNARPKIYEKKWNDDFSELRNYGISLCSYSYCVMLDADEYIKKECRNNFRDIITKAMVVDDSLLLAPVIDNLNGTILKNNPRIFKIHKDVRYKGRVHEYLYSEQTSQITYLPELVINHSGYHDDVYLKKQKKERNLKLLRKQIAEEPSNMRWFYFLSRYLDENTCEYKNILFKYGELGLPYDENIEIYALNLKTALIIHLISTNNFESAFNHASQLYSIYKDSNTTALYMISALICSLERFEEHFYGFIESISELKNLNVDDMLFVKIPDNYVENCIRFILARLENIRKNHG